MSAIATPAAQLASPDAPWLGLRSFTEAAHEYFFGRGDELADLYERIVDKPLTILFGQSGLGKSSLLQAALMPRLRQSGFLPVLIRFDHDAEAASLEDQLVAFLVAALAEAGFASHASALHEAIRANVETGWDTGALVWLIFHDPTNGFIPRSGKPPGSLPRPVLLIDQFEEIFTLGDRAARRPMSASFRDTLACLVENRPPASLRALLEQDDDLAERLDYQARHMRVLLSLREDFLHVLERWRRSMPSLMENRLELRMLSGPQAFEAVVRPGQLRDDNLPIIPDEVGQAIVRFVAGAEDDVPLAEIDAVPPLLSLVCAELNAQRIASGDAQVTRAQFEGHSGEILQSFYRRSFEPASYGAAFDDIPDADGTLQTLQRLVEDRLLSPDGFRESIAFDTIARDLARTISPDTAKVALDEIVERRLLTVEERGGVRRLELAHDVLVPIVKASRDERQEKETLINAQRERERAEAETLRIAKERNRLRRLAILAGALAVVAAIVSAVAIRKTQEAKQSAIKAAENAASAEENSARARENLSTATQIAENVLSQSASKLSRYSGMQSLRMEIVQQTLQSFESLSRQAPDDPAVQSAYARAKLEALLSKIELNRSAANVSPLLKAFEDLDRMARAQPDNLQLEVYALNAVNAVHRFALDTGHSDEAQKLVLSHLARGKHLASDPKASPEAHLAYVRLLNGAGNMEDDSGRRTDFYLQAIKALKPCDALAITDSDYLRAYCSPRINLADRLRRDGHPEQSQGLMDETLVACSKAMLVMSDQPPVLETVFFAYQEAADLEASKPTDQVNTLKAVTYAEDAVEMAQTLVRTNPGSSKYLTRLAEGQNTLAQRLQSGSLPAHLLRKAGYYYKQAALNHLRAAQAAHDSPALWKNAGDALATVTAQLMANESPEAGEFFEKRMQAYKDAASLVTLTANQWTSLAGCFSDYSAYLEGKKKYSDAYRLALGGLEAYVSHSNAQNWKTEEWFQIGISNLIAAATRQINNGEKTGDALPLFAKALPLLDKPSNRMRASDYLWACINVATAHIKGGNIETAERTLIAARTAFAAQPASPSHYNLQWAERQLHWNLSNCYEKKGIAMLAYEEAYAYAAKLWAFHGKAVPVAKISRPTPADLKVLRAEIDGFKPSMKRFTVPCDQNGSKVSVEVYIRDYVPDGVQPLADQVASLRELNIQIPTEVLDSFSRLYKIARENNVSFTELCVYALGSAGDSNNILSQQELEKMSNQLATAKAADRGRLMADQRDAEAKYIEKLQKDLRDGEGKHIEKLQKDIAACQLKLKESVAQGRLLTLKLLFDSYLDLAIQSSSRDRALCLSSIGSAYQTLVMMEIENVDGEEVKRWRSRVAEVETYARERFKITP